MSIRPMVALCGLIILFATVNDSFARCGGSGLTRGVTRPKTIPIQTERSDAPVFYILYPDRWVALYFRPADVLAALDAVIAKNQEANPAPAKSGLESFRDALAADLPLKESTDLYKYTLHDLGFRQDMEFIIADLMRDGQVVVDNWPLRTAKDAENPVNDKYDETAIVMVSKGRSFGEEWRAFCTSGGKDLLSVTYIIVD